MITRAIYTFLFAMKRVTRLPNNEDDAEIIFAHEYLNKTISVKAVHIFSLLIKIVLSLIPIFLIRNAYVTQMSTVYLIVAIIIIAYVLTWRIDIVADNYELDIYLEGLRIARTNKKERV